MRPVTPAALADNLPAPPANITNLPPLPNLAPPTPPVPPVPNGRRQPPAHLPPPAPAAPPSTTLHFSRDPVGPTPLGQYLAPFTPPEGPMNQALLALGTVQVSPAYTGPVAMPTTQPPNFGLGLAPLSPRQRRVLEENLDYSIQLEIPSIYKLTRLESEAALKERMRNEFRLRGDRIVFPEEQPLSRAPYQGRQWPPSIEIVEPAYVCHHRLYFEQINSERLGWSVGFLQPAVSALHFYWDAFLLPYHLATLPGKEFDCSAGKCFPGDPAPLALYPPMLSVTGVLAETAVLTTGFFVFP